MSQTDVFNTLQNCDKAVKKTWSSQGYALQRLVFFRSYFSEKLGKSDSRRVSEARCIEL